MHRGASQLLRIQAVRHENRPPLLGAAGSSIVELGAARDSGAATATVQDAVGRPVVRGRFSEQRARTAGADAYRLRPPPIPIRPIPFELPSLEDLGELELRSRAADLGGGVDGGFVVDLNVARERDVACKEHDNCGNAGNENRRLVDCHDQWLLVLRRAVIGAIAEEPTPPLQNGKYPGVRMHRGRLTKEKPPPGNRRGFCFSD